MKNLGMLVLLMVSLVGCASVDSTTQRQNIQPQAPMVYKGHLATAIHNGYDADYFQSTMVDACEMKARVNQEV